MYIEQLAKLAAQGSPNPLKVIPDMKTSFIPAGGEQPNLFGNPTLFPQRLGRSPGQPANQQLVGMHQLATNPPSPAAQEAQGTPHSIPMSERAKIWQLAGSMGQTK